jgi:two-component sensor histidine kinase
LNKRTDSSSSEAARALRQRWLCGIFLAGWTVFASVAVWWLPLQPDSTIIPDWIVNGDVISQASLADRIGNWFNLLDVDFHGVYPFILLAPYVVWLAARFYLEEGGWRVSLPVHLVGCVVFVIASDILAAYIGSGRQVIVTVRSEAIIGKDGKQYVLTMGQTNLSRNFNNAPPLRLPPTMLNGAGRRVAQTNLTNGLVRGETVAWTGPGEPRPHGFFMGRRWASRLLSDVLNVFGYAALLGLVHAVHFYHRSREREGRAAVLEAQLTKARLSTLQAQLHPHFLFNALNAISTLLRRDTRAAQDALASFSELLRLALSHSTQPEVSLREDVEFLRRYVEIQQTRLGERLQFEEVIAQDALDNLVPALLLQPLVENAIRHGIEPSPDPGVVRVIVQPEGERLVVTVEDNGAGLSTNGTERAGIGIGLQNLRSRLETLYGDRQRVEVGTRTGGGVSVRVEIPLRQARVAEMAAVAL